jgi:hypothetical protein
MNHEQGNGCTPAFRIHRSEFSCSLATALLDVHFKDPNQPTNWMSYTREVPSPQPLFLPNLLFPPRYVPAAVDSSHI